VARDRTDWGIVAAAVGAGVFVAFQSGKLPPAVPVLRADLGLSLVTAGWVLSLFTAVAALAAVGVGALADRAGARRLVLFGLVATAAASALGALAEGPGFLLAARFLEGLGAVAVFVAAPSILLRAIRPGDQRVVFGVWSSYMPAGTSAMILAAPFVLDLVGWRGLWLVNAALLAAAALVVWPATRGAADPPPGPGRDLGRDLGAVLGTRLAWLLALVFATYTGSYLSVTAFLPSFLIEREAYAPAWAATATALIVAGNVVGNVCGGWLLQRGAPRAVLIGLASAAMGGLGLVVYAEATPDALRIAAAAGFSIIGGLLPASVLGAAPLAAPSPAHVATTNGLVMQLANAGQLLTPPAFAALASGLGWARAPMLTAALGAGGVVLAFWIGAELRRRAARAQ
jgi:predicted MFS family arabinose efflux permease